MRLMHLLFVMVFILPGLLSAQDAQESCKPSGPIKIDAEFDDWQIDWLVDKKGKFIYNICNDSANLYVRLKISDEMVRRKVGLFGLTLFLNPNGKKVGKMGLKYPIEKDPKELKPPTENQTQESIAELNRSLVRDVEVLELVGFTKESYIASRLGMMNGLEVFITSDSHGDYMYEAKIPFKAFKIDKSTVDVLGVAFVTGRLVVKDLRTTASPAGGGYGNMGYTNMRRMYGYGYGSQPATPYNEWTIATTLSVAVKLK